MACGNAFFCGAVDKDGNIYVIDARGQSASRAACRLLKIDDQGSLVWTVKLMSTGGTTSVDNVAGIDVDSEGNIYVLVTGLGITTATLPASGADTVNVYKLDDQGSVIWRVDPNWGDPDACGVRVDDQGRIYIFAGGTTSNARAFKILDDQGSSILTGATTYY